MDAASVTAPTKKGKILLQLFIYKSKLQEGIEDMITSISERLYIPNVFILIDKKFPFYGAVIIHFHR